MQDVITRLKGYGVLPLSYSKMNCLRACGRQFQLRYLEKAEAATPVDTLSATVGKFNHSVLEMCISKGQNFGFVEDAIDFGLTWQTISRTNGLTHNEYDMAQAQRSHLNEILRRVLTVINTYKLKPTPEAMFCMSTTGIVQGNVPWNSRFFYGFIDLFCLTQDESRGLLIDYKSHGKSDDNAEEVERQTRIYSYFMLRRYPSLVSIQPGCAYIPDEDIDMQDPICRAQLPELEGYVKGLFEEFGDRFDAGFNPEKSKYCNWCGYMATCPLHKKKTKRKASRRTTMTGKKLPALV